jgi:hypothetical protein
MRSLSGESSNALPTRIPTPPDAAIRSVTPVVSAPSPRTSAAWMLPPGFGGAASTALALRRAPRCDLADRLPGFGLRSMAGP